MKSSSFLMPLPCPNKTCRESQMNLYGLNGEDNAQFSEQYCLICHMFEKCFCYQIPCEEAWNAGLWNNYPCKSTISLCTINKVHCFIGFHWSRAVRKWCLPEKLFQNNACKCEAAIIWHYERAPYPSLRAMSVDGIFCYSRKMGKEGFVVSFLACSMIDYWSAYKLQRAN